MGYSSIKKKVKRRISVVLVQRLNITQNFIIKHTKCQNKFSFYLRMIYALQGECENINLALRVRAANSDKNN